MFEDLEKLHIDRIYGVDKQVYAYKCPSCGRLHYPAVLRCKECGNRRYPEDEAELIWHKKGYVSWEQIPLEGPCKLLTFTRLWNLPVGFDDRYLDFGIVAFENGLSAMGHLRVEAPRGGMSLAARTAKLRQIHGEDFYGLVFEED